MRILMTADAVGGVWTYARELAASLADQDVEILLATMGSPPSRSQRAELATMPHVRLESSEYRLEWMERPWEDVDAAGRWLLQLADTFQPDIVHLNGYCHGDLPWTAPVLMVAHSCVLSWIHDVRGEEAGSEWEEYRRRVRRGLHAADLVLAPTCAMLERANRFYGPLAATRVIYNGLGAPRDTEVLPREPAILSAGRLWDDAKNMAVLDRAAARLPWPVRVAGPPAPPGSTADQRFTSLVALGTLDARQMRRLYSTSSIYAHPARYEPFGLAVLEAAQHGCALVLSDLDSLHELWGGAAAFVDPDDPDAWRAELSRLISDADARRRLGEAAQRRSARYGREAMGGRYLDAYRELLADRVAALTPGEESRCTS